MTVSPGEPGPDEQSNSDEEPRGEQSEQSPPELETPRFSQRQVNTLLADEKRKYREKRAADEALIERGKKAEEAENAKRPLEERVATLSSEGAQKDSRISELEADKLRLTLAGKAQLHPDLWGYLQGDSEGEINSHIETLKKFKVADEADNDQQQQQRGGSKVQPSRQQGRPSSNDGATGTVGAGRDLFRKMHGQTTDAGAG